MFLANENFPRPSILLLRELGYKIISIQETHQGISDSEVLRIAFLKKSKSIVAYSDSICISKSFQLFDVLDIF